MGSFAQPDLHKRLLDPKYARIYIENFDWTPLERPDRIVLSGNREVALDPQTLTDDDAVATALALLIDVEIPMVMRTKKYEQYDQ